MILKCKINLDQKWERFFYKSIFLFDQYKKNQYFYQLLKNQKKNEI